MANIRQIAQLGAPILRQRAAPVTDIWAPAIQIIINDMRDTLANSGGVGLAAPQIFQSWRIIIVASRPTSRYPYAPEMQPTIMINPSYRALSEETEKDWEGCLSIPGIRARVPRYKHIAITYTDVDGEPATQTLDDFVARIFQHEYDHLDGLVYLDRVEDNRDIFAESEFYKLIENRQSK